ncbi:MAG: Ig-like domain-containing domain [Microscillaceae bacterium]|jgi:uncharacterized protein (DUF2141 family)|nr:Ig-like domain-containing domain [Microscillaceae bacterium]
MQKLVHYVLLGQQWLFKSVLIAFFLSPLLVLNNCANRMAPTGGAKDSLAPYLKESIPRNQGINHTGKTLVLKFNEWIREKELLKQLIITPPIQQGFSFKIIRDRLEITILDSAWRTNTTYNLNFRKGIEDITEGNVAILDTLKREPLRLAFSTGNTIDTLQVRGKVLSLLTNEAVKDAVVSLYRLDDTLRIDRDKPYYYTLTDEKGEFKIENIRAGKYQIYALADKDNNSLYREPEAIGFINSGISVGDTAQNNDLILQIASEDHTRPKLARARPLDAEYLLEFSEGLNAINIEVQDNPQKDLLAYNLDEKGKILKLFNLQSVYDSLSLRINVKDSLGNALDTTAKIAFKKIEEKENRRRKETENTGKVLDVKMELRTGTGIEKQLELDFIFDKPVKSLDFQKINYRLDKDTINQSPLLEAKDTASYRWDATRSRLSVTKKINLKSEILILLDSAAFVSVKGETNRKNQQSFKLKDVANFATISGRVNTKEPAYIIQLLNDKFALIAERRNTPNFEFLYLPAGTYQIRVIIDKNNNGRWDSSNTLKNIPAEPVYFRFLQNNGKLKERWDIEGTLVEF